MGKIPLFALLLITASTYSFYANGKSNSLPRATLMQCKAINKAQVAALFDRWNASLKTGDPRRVAHNYTHDAVLLPTLSSKVRLTDEERIDYFKSFLKKGPVGRIDSRKIRIGCNDAIDTGNYTFSFKDGTKAAARFTFTYAWNGRAWLITSHHSSALPATQ